MPDQKTMPYAPPTAILDFLNKYRHRGLAFPVTLEVLQRAGVSPALAPRTLQALKLLNFLDAEGNNTEAGEALRLASTSDYPARLAAHVRQVYSEVFQFVDPATSTPEGIRDAFRPYDPQGQQGRMVTLFLGLCEAAGLVDPAQRRAAASNPSPASRKASAGRVVQRRAKQDHEDSPGLPNGVPQSIRALISQLPPEGTYFPKEKRERLKAALDGLFAFCYSDQPLADPDSDTGSPND